VRGEHVRQALAHLRASSTPPSTSPMPCSRACAASFCCLCSMPRWESLTAAHEGPGRHCVEGVEWGNYDAFYRGREALRAPLSHESADPSNYLPFADCSPTPRMDKGFCGPLLTHPRCRAPVARFQRRSVRDEAEAPTRARTRSAGVRPLRRRGSCDAACSRKPLLSTTTKRPFPWTVVASTFPS
jgi:hypothetical protein